MPLPLLRDIYFDNSTITQTQITEINEKKRENWQQLEIIVHFFLRLPPSLFPNDKHKIDMNSDSA
jgi:hypothetical protein